MHPFGADPEEITMTLMPPRSWLFVPADSEKKIAKALDSAADAVIFDLEDSVTTERKNAARAILKAMPPREGGPRWWVRINPVGSEHLKADLKLLASSDMFGIVLPKAEGVGDVTHIAHRTGNVPIHAIVTETAASLFCLSSYREAKAPLVAMSWGAEDLSAALGASSKYDADGELSFTHKWARSMTLAGAVAAKVQPVDGVFADYKDNEGLEKEARAAAREGFTGKLAIHPGQVDIINAAFTPSAADIAHAEAIIDAFAANPDAGVLSINGRMVDRPHLIQAQGVLARAR